MNVELTETPQLIAFRSALAAWNARTNEDQLAWFSHNDPTLEDRAQDGRVRVGMLCPCLVMGGAEAWQLTLGRYTDAASIDWRGVCVIGQEKRIDAAMLDATSRLMPVTIGLEAARILAAQCDILVTWAIDDLSALLGPLSSRLKVVAVVHAPKESEWGQTVYARTSGVDRWVAVSELALEALPDSSRVIPASVIWNAIDRDRLVIRRDRSTMRKLWGVPDDAPIAGYLGRLSHEKDPQAMVRLTDQLPEPWRVVVVGGGDEPLDLVKPARMHLAGVDPAAGDVLNAFDVLVVPSLYESFGLSIAEGLCAGVPVVSTEVGIAKIVPGITPTIPVNADGSTIARAVLAAHRTGPPEAVRRILSRLQPERFGREWTELLLGLAPPLPKRTSLIDPGVRDAVNACPARGSVLPISIQDDCGCQGKELSGCLEGRGIVPGRVTLRDCLDCKGDRIGGTGN